MRGGEPRPAGELKKAFSQIDDSWKAGHHWKPGKDGGYFVKAARLADEITKSPPGSDARSSPLSLLSDLLSKKFEMSEITMDDLENPADDFIGICDLQAIACLANFLMDNRRIPNQDPATTSQILARYLGRVRSERIRDYKPKPSPLNVAPPTGGNEPMIAGMDPDDIKDPVLRAKYKAAIREAAENSVENMRQTQLLGMDQLAISEAFISYLVETFRGRRDAAATLDECMKTAKLTDQEKKKVLDGVGAR